MGKVSGNYFFSWWSQIVIKLRGGIKVELVTLKNQFFNWFEKIKENIGPYLEEKQIIKEHDPTLQERIEEARQEWVVAQQYFNTVTEPELIDYASYMIRAAETKYTYLLNKAKRRGEIDG